MIPRALVVVHSLALLSLATVASADEPHSVVVNVLTFGKAGGQPTGYCNPVTITASSSPTGQVRVGFFESEVGGTGDKWRAAGWMAAVTASMLTDFDPRTMRVSFEFEGLIDGPSAGALMTCGVLAAARGDKVRPDVAMTGTINPDGTIGPVSGISYKIAGAAAEGMKLILIPASKRFDTDADGQRIDLLEHGQKFGVQVVNVFDVYQAYELLTGQELPRAPSAHSPQVNLKVQQYTREKIAEWQARYEKSLKSYLEIDDPGAGTDEVVALYQQGADAIKNSNLLLNEGDFTAAFWDRVMATACGYISLEMGRCRYTYTTRGYDGLLKRLRDNDWLAQDVANTAARLRRETPRSLDQLSVYLIACDTFLEAAGLQRLADGVLDALDGEESELGLELAGGAAQNQIIAWLDLKLANDYLDMAEGYEGKPIPRDTPWMRAGDYLRRASAANMAVFDSIIVEPAAERFSVSADQIRNRLMIRDRNYAIIRAAEKFVAPNLEEYFGDGDALGYAFLASCIHTHTRAAGLLAKYYSLDAELNSDGYVVDLPRQRTLAEWLTFSDDQTRRSIALLQDNGIDASPCAQLYAIARVKSRRDVTQQMEGLVEFWSAELHARVLRLLSGITTDQPQNGEIEDEAEAYDKLDIGK